MRSYDELSHLHTFEERLEYLSLDGAFFGETFGGSRWLNQSFYQSDIWREARTQVIARDLGCDLGLEGYEIHDGIVVHHINPLTPRQCENFDPCMWDTNNLICVILTVAEQLRSTGELEDAGGPFYITQLSGKVASSAHIEYHARIIAQKFLARELITFTATSRQRLSTKPKTWTT